MNAPNTLAEAAEILTTQAEELRLGSTYLGDWRDEHEAQAEHSRVVRVARELAKIDIGIPTEMLPYICAAAFIAGYVVAKWLG